MLGSTPSATIATRDRPSLTARGLPRLDTLRAKEHPRGQRERAGDEHRQADPRPGRRRGHVADRERKSQAVLEQHRGTGERDVPGARRAVACATINSCSGMRSRVREQHAHARADWRGDASADEEHADERADGDARDEQPRRPQQERVQQRRHADVRDVDDHHRHERDVIADRERQEHEIFAASQSPRRTGAVNTLSTNRLARALAMNPAASGMNASGTSP